MHYHWNIVGHETLLHSLENDMQHENLAHAYLFSGPEKVGKYIVAKKMAHILQCPNNFCHECPTCIQIEKGCHPDTIEFVDDGESIKIEQIRGVIDQLQMTAPSHYKIFLAEKIERMTLEAAHCLLKTLEEPPEKTIFLFTTASLKNLLPTIVSRMRILNFHHCPEDILQQRIAEEYPDTDQETLRQVSRFALGKPGIAFRLLRDPQLLSLYRRMYQDILHFFESEYIFNRFCYVQELVEDPTKIDHFLDILTHLCRSRMLENPLNKSKFPGILERISGTRSALKRNANKKLALEGLMLSL